MIQCTPEGLEPYTSDWDVWRYGLYMACGTGDDLLQVGLAESRFVAEAQKTEEIAEEGE
jgi:hypothetical protein